MENNKAYYAIIPANVRYDKELTPNAKLLYGEITALCNERGYCWASNGYFAELYNASIRSISRWVSQLEEKNYIKVELSYKNNSMAVEERRIRLTFGLPIDKIDNTSGQNCHGGIDKNDDTSIDKNVQDNNTVINNTVNNKEKNIKENLSQETCDVASTSSFKKKGDQHSVPYDEIVLMYHNICRSLPKVVKISPKRRKQMQAIYKEFGIDGIRDIFIKAEKSKFLTSRTDNVFTADFDFLTNINRAINVLEGKYDDRLPAKQIDTDESLIEI